MHNYIISGTSCYPCGAVVEKVGSTDEECCRYLLYQRKFIYFSRLLWVSSHILDTSAWIFLSLWHEPVFLCSLSCWSLKLFNQTPGSLCFPFSLCFQSPVQFPPLCCEVQNVDLGFTRYTELCFRVWNRSRKATLLVLEQSPVSVNTVGFFFFFFGYHQ